MMKHNCLLCGILVLRTHGNYRYCCDEHEKQKKKERQNHKYALMKPILPLIIKNLEVLDAIYRSPETKKEFTRDELIKRGLKFGMYAVYPLADNKHQLMFGAYSLIQSADTKTYKLELHETRLY
jgi:hypothetical protein